MGFLHDPGYDQTIEQVMLGTSHDSPDRRLLSIYFEFGGTSFTRGFIFHLIKTLK